MPADLPLSVWPTAQRNARAQRAGRYVEISGHHPAKMLPAIAHGPSPPTPSPATWSSTRWPASARPSSRPSTSAVTPSASSTSRSGPSSPGPTSPTPAPRARPGTARWSAATPGIVTTVVDPAVRGLVALVLTSPPYGPSLHGQVTARPGQGIAKSHDRYSTDPANLAHVGLAGLLDAMRTILAGCACLLRPGGFVAMTVRPWWHAGQLIDLPGAMVRVGEEAGLVLYERNVALLAGLRGDQLVPRTSFFALEQVRKARSCRHPPPRHRSRGLSRLPATA